MEEARARELVTEAGNRLVQEGLVARTWGNVSCRLDETHYVITPSGISYNLLKPEDMVVMDMTTGEAAGNHKPSGEKGVHTASYLAHPDAGFVIHTHQTYATAISIMGFDSLKIRNDEIQRLGGLALADYGLPGMKKLTDSVSKCLAEGAETVLMAHHGPVICGKDADDAFEKAKLLEEICRRNTKTGFPQEAKANPDAIIAFTSVIKKVFPNAIMVQSPQLCTLANRGLRIDAQLDDMAQMVGPFIPVGSGESAQTMKLLERYHAVLIPEMGVLVSEDTEEDTEALAELVRKAGICRLHTEAYGRSGKLPIMDSVLMKIVYEMKYSKQNAAAKTDKIEEDTEENNTEERN